LPKKNRAVGSCESKKLSHISQGSVATHLTCDEVFSHGKAVCKHMMTLLTRVASDPFLAAPLRSSWQFWCSSIDPQDSRTQGPRVKTGYESAFTPLAFLMKFSRNKISVNMMHVFIIIFVKV